MKTRTLIIIILTMLLSLFARADQLSCLMQYKLTGDDMPDRVTVNDNGDNFEILTPNGFFETIGDKPRPGALFSGQLQNDIPNDEYEHFRKAQGHIIQPGWVYNGVVWTYKLMPRGSNQYEYGFTLWIATKDETEFRIHQCSKMQIAHQ